jgi:hypothetical protein
MKKLTLTIAFIFVVMLCIGQQINKAEYFIDSDPGFGLATPIPITVPANNLSLSFDVNASGLTQGFHMMVLRARDNLGRWSNTRQHVFYVFKAQSVTESKINKAEYFIDTDPGFGLATPIPITIPAKNLSLSFDVDASVLTQGFHMMVLSARDDQSRWSNTHQQVFYVFIVKSITESKINKAEYFIDNDPGFGLATPIPITSPGNNLSLSFDVNASVLTQGFHMMVLRASDDMGRWSNTHQQVFYVFKSIPSAISNINGIEYFIDDDPGFGNGTPVDVAIPDSNVTADFIVNLSGVSNGDHILYLRGKDVLNRWSPTYIHAFSIWAVGIGEKEVIPWFRMYPNPNEGNFIIDFTDLQSSAIKITINDLNGRTVYSNELHSENIPISVDLPTGVYMLTVEAGNQLFMQKLVISR